MTPERFAMGMTFDQYVTYTGTPENLQREAGWWLGLQRRDFEYPAVYHKDRIAEAMQARARTHGESPEQAWDRFIRDWGALQQSPFFAIWASATVDEIISALHERIVVGG